MPGISVVINTLNEEQTLERAIRSVLNFADEILVCDMHSDDDSAILAKKLGAKVIFHKRAPFVELARNFTISKASHEWVLILDPDEEIPESLGKHLKEMISKPLVSTFVEIPRKNIIFGKWMKTSLWWPDYNIRFFKKGLVTWINKIHRPPKTQGQGIKLSLDERWAITHYHYSSISQFLTRLDRYTEIQAKELITDGYKFSWIDLFYKPLSEFLSRYFANRGYEDGVHGLALSFLQSFSFIIVYLKVWQHQGFKEEELNLEEVKEIAKKSGEEVNYWFKYGNLSKNPVKALLQRVKNKLT